MRAIMSAVWAVVLASSQAAWADSAPPTTVHQACQWQPATAPYVGTTEDALRRLEGAFTPDQREWLRDAVASRRPTAYVRIDRDRIYTVGDPGGVPGVKPRIAMMHSGLNGLCVSVDRSHWSDTHVEGGMLFVPPAATLGVLWPAVCRNLALVELTAPVFEPPERIPAVVMAARALRLIPEPAPEPPQATPYLDPEARQSIGGLPAQWFVIPDAGPGLRSPSSRAGPALLGGAPGTGSTASSVVGTVSEPSLWWFVVVAALAFARGRNR